MSIFSFSQHTESIIYMLSFRMWQHWIFPIETYYGAFNTVFFYENYTKMLHLKKNINFFHNFQYFLSLKYKYTIMCNNLNKYNNLNDAHYIRYTSLWKMYKKRYSLFVWYIFKTAAIKKKSLWSQSIPLSKYPYTLGFHTRVKTGFFSLNLMPKRGYYFGPWSGISEVLTADSYGASHFMSVWIFSCVCVAQSIKSTNGSSKKQKKVSWIPKTLTTFYITWYIISVNKYTI